jgi:putative heme-binding domain-containing protein
MARRCFVAAFSVFGLAIFLLYQSWALQAQPPVEAQWIWFNEGNPRADAPVEARFFRKIFTLAGPADKATLEITADNRYTVWLNGKEVGKGEQWMTLDRYNVAKQLVRGKNVIAVRAVNDGGPAGLVVRLRYTIRKGKPGVIISDGAWKASKTAPDGWQKLNHKDAKWPQALALGTYGKVGPWVNGGGGAKPAEPRFKVPDGFRVELAVKDPGDRGKFSLVNMTFDGKGRLLVSLENGPILLCTQPDKREVCQEVRTYCDKVKNAHGMCWIKDALYLVGEGPKGTGLYRCRDTKKEDRIDEVTLVHRFNGGINEHGPHAVVYGPDGFLYVVIGNHAFAHVGPAPGKEKWPNPLKLAENSPLRRWPTGGMGPDQGQLGSTEDVLLPRMNDANGHAANLRAPGGTIWRMDLDGKNVGLFSAGYRNQFDAAFSPSGELFTFDSDMEWDEGLPWYRAVRINHCTPGSDFLWRTGAANTPNYYLDSLPPLFETGRGSPVGVVFYDHDNFPKKYRGSLLLADWSLGIIYAVHLNPKGGTYSAKVEKFCTGSPLNVTDLEVGPDGSVYFTMGGRDTYGGVYRIVPIRSLKVARGFGKKPSEVARQMLDEPQPLAAWSRARIDAVLDKMGPAKKEVFEELIRRIENPKEKGRVRGLSLLQIHGGPLLQELLVRLAADSDPLVKSQAIYFLGVKGYKEAKPILVKALNDSNPRIRRRACEALVRAGLTPPLEDIWPLLGETDLFVQTAARLILERMDAKTWAEKIKTPSDGVRRPAPSADDRIAWQAIVALAKQGKLAEFKGIVFHRLNQPLPAENEALLDYLRTLQLALFHAGEPPAACKEIAKHCLEAFPVNGLMANRELAILLAHLALTGQLDKPVQQKLLAALKASKGDRLQQMHYVYCLRTLKKDWTPAQKVEMVAWFEGTRDWRGGNSFTGFIQNMFKQFLATYSVAERSALLAAIENTPYAALVLLQQLQSDRQASMAPALRALAVRLSRPNKIPRADELRQAAADALVRIASEQAKAEFYPDLLNGLKNPNAGVVLEAIAGLKKNPTKPKATEAAPFRALLLAASLLNEGNRWQAVELLRHWTGDKEFGAEKGQWKPELQSWGRWFNQSFPMEPAIPDIGSDKPAESKYKYDDLLKFLTKGEGAKGNAVKGKVVFEKGLCTKCHRYGKEGEGVGPDLTNLAKRFKRADVLDSILYPSKVISDQYRSTTIVTKKGLQITGLAADQGDTWSVLLPDGTKTVVKKKDVEQRFASLVSVMPERLLDTLTKAEIADLFAYMESVPPK